MPAVQIKAVIAARRQQRLLLVLFTVAMATAAFAPRNERALLLARGAAAPIAMAALTGQPSAIAYTAIGGALRNPSGFAARPTGLRTASNGNAGAQPAVQAFAANLIPLPDQTQAPASVDGIGAPAASGLTAGGTALGAPAPAGPGTGNGSPNLSIPNPSGSNPAAFSTPATLSGVPEPSMWLSMMVGFLTLGAMLRRRKVASADVELVALHRN